MGKRLKALTFLSVVAGRQYFDFFPTDFETKFCLVIKNFSTSRSRENVSDRCTGDEWLFGEIRSGDE